MSGSVVDPLAPSTGARSTVTPARWLVLAAVTIGLLTGSLACAAGLVTGHDHDEIAATSPADEPVGHAHASHGAPSAPDDGRHPPDVPTTESHPGMACVVPVDLRFPQPTAVQVSVSCGGLVDPNTLGWSADIDPPVPRPS